MKTFIEFLSEAKKDTSEPIHNGSDGTKTLHDIVRHHGDTSENKGANIHEPRGTVYLHNSRGEQGIKNANRLHKHLVNHGWNAEKIDKHDTKYRHPNGGHIHILRYGEETMAHVPNHPKYQGSLK